MSFQFKPATKEQSKLRAAIFAPSGGGKTFTALRVATGMAEPTKAKIAVIDTERGSASKYADRFTFDVLELPEYTIETYVHAINAAAQAGYGVLIIDSLTHAWQQLLEHIDKLAKAKYRGNTWSAWSEGTPQHRQLVDTILRYPGHLIATMRTKTEWSTESTGGGKSRPVRVGLAPEQGKGIEYEFDFLVSMTDDHIATVIKDRSGKFQDKMIEKPGEGFGRDLVGWLSKGKAAQPQKTINQQIAEELLFAIDGCVDMATLGLIWGEDDFKQKLATLTPEEKEMVVNCKDSKKTQLQNGGPLA